MKLKSINTSDKVSCGAFAVTFKGKLAGPHNINSVKSGRWQFNGDWHGSCYHKKRRITILGGIKMKKVLSSIVAALVAVAFAGVVFAAEPVAAPAAPAAPEVKKEEKAPVVKKAKKKKAKKAKKAVKLLQPRLRSNSALNGNKKAASPDAAFFICF
jgi:hypothetical protein